MTSPHSIGSHGRSQVDARGALAPPLENRKLCEKNKKKKRIGIKRRIKHKEFILNRLKDLFRTTKGTNIHNF